MRSAPSRAIRALPTLLRIGVAETVAYRAEFLVWMLTSTMPLIMLALWTSVAAEAPFENYTSAHFVAYFLAALVVRNLTGNWVAWQLAEEIRLGVLSMRLLRPIHPFIAFATSHVAALPSPQGWSKQAHSAQRPMECSAQTRRLQCQLH